MLTRLAAAVLLVSVAACNDDRKVGLLPAPSVSTVVGLDVRCPTTLLVGEVQSCVPIAHLSSGLSPSVRAESWSSLPPGIVLLDGDGMVRGQQVGQAVVTTTFRGHTAGAIVSVPGDDAIRLRSLGPAGSLIPGALATFRATGFYAVHSAPSGRLSLVVSDDNRTLASTTPLIVPSGGDAFELAVSLVVPPSSAKICQSTVLTVGAHAVAAPSGPSAELVGCVTVAAR